MQRTKRKIAGAAVWLSLLGGCQQSQQAFQIRSLKMGERLKTAESAGIVIGCQKMTNTRDERCSLKGDDVAGAFAFDKDIEFRDGRLQYIAIMIAPDDFRTAGENLAAAYGKPCKAETGFVDTSIGPIGGNQRLYWCFSNGDLLLEQFAYGSLTDKSLIEFPASSRNLATATGPNDL